MRRTAPGLLLFALAAALPASAEPPAPARVRPLPPPPPVIVVKEEPRLVQVVDTRVFVVTDERWDDDCFRYGGWWWTWHRGHWFRARDWRGPYVAIEERGVPAAVITVPERHWKRHPHALRDGAARRVPDVVIVEREPRERGRRGR